MKQRIGGRNYPRRAPNFHESGTFSRMPRCGKCLWRKLSMAVTLGKAPHITVWVVSEDDKNVKMPVRIVRDETTWEQLVEMSAQKLSLEVTPTGQRRRHPTWPEPLDGERAVAKHQMIRTG